MYQIVARPHRESGRGVGGGERADTARSPGRRRAVSISRHGTQRERGTARPDDTARSHAGNHITLRRPEPHSGYEGKMFSIFIFAPCGPKPKALNHPNPQSSECGTYKTGKTRFRPWLPDKSPDEVEYGSGVGGFLKWGGKPHYLPYPHPHPYPYPTLPYPTPPYPTLPSEAEPCGAQRTSPAGPRWARTRACLSLSNAVSNSSQLAKEGAGISNYRKSEFPEIKNEKTPSYSR